MHLINNFLFQDTPSGDDVLYTALVSKANALGYTLPSTSTLSALNTLIKDMRRIGMIQRLDLFHVYASDLDTTALFRLMNIVNPEMIGVESTHPIVWDNQGSRGNKTGGLAYINTNFNPYLGGYNYQRNNASIGAVLFYNPESPSGGFCRVMGGSLIEGSVTGGATILESSNSEGISRINNQRGASSSGIYDLRLLGLKVLNRTSSTNVDVYNRERAYVITSPASELQNEYIYIHNTTVVGVAGSTGATGVSCAFAGASIPYEMAQNFRQIYNKYLRSIGLQQIA